MSDPTAQPVLFETPFAKRTTFAFDTELQSSDGGAVLLGALDRRIRLTERLTRCLADPRDARKVAHTTIDLLRQEIYSRALGYADGNDAGILRDDPALQTACGRLPRRDGSLASQPSLSRFEHQPSARELLGMQATLEDLVIERLRRHHRGAKEITIDLDTTHDPTHGQQQLSFFHGYYDCHCYLPLLGFLSVDGHVEQWLFHARLRSGKARDVRGVVPLLRRVVPKLKKAFPKARILVRVDSGFTTPRVLAAIDRLKVSYLAGIGTNAAFEAEVEDHWVLLEATAECEQRSVRTFDEFTHQTRSWTKARRIVAKVELLVHPERPMRRNARFVVTNLRHRARTVYQKYCVRGDSENRIKELKDGLAIDRTSCTSYQANAFRVLLTAAAYLLFQELRWRLRGTRLGRTQVTGLRESLLKIGVRVVVSVRRIVMHGPTSCPTAALWRKAALSVGAVPV